MSANAIYTTSLQRNILIVGSNQEFRVWNSNVYESIEQFSERKMLISSDGVDVFGNIRTSGEILPTSCNQQDLGSVNFRWRDIYLSGNTIDLGGTRLSRNKDTGGINIVTENNEVLPIATGDIFALGSIGVGTSNPTESIEVINGNVKADAFIGDASLLTGLANVAFTGDYNNLSNTVFTLESASKASFAGQIGIGGSTNGNKALYVTGNMEASGSVVASSMITSNLYVVGDVTVLNTTSSNTEQMVITNAGTGPALKVVQTGASVTHSVAEFYDADVQHIALMIANNGLVGMGTSTPNARLHIHHIGTGDILRVDDDTAPDVSPFIITQEGNVGIGTQTPDANLQVAGVVKATQFIGDGSLLTGIVASGGTSGGGGDSVWRNQGSNVYVIGCNVGIGTSSPTTNLQVEGNALFNGTVRTNSNVELYAVNEYTYTYGNFTESNMITYGSVPVVSNSPNGVERSIYLNGEANNYIVFDNPGFAASSLTLLNGLTIECWVNFVEFKNHGYAWLMGSVPPSGMNWSFGVTSTGALGFYYFSGSRRDLTSTSTLSLNTWYHIAVTIDSSNNLRMFLNGTMVYGPTGVLPRGYDSSSTFVIGRFSVNTHAYLTNVRVITGAALYTSSFTVPQLPLPDANVGTTRIFIKPVRDPPVYTRVMEISSDTQGVGIGTSSSSEYKLKIKGSCVIDTSTSNAYPSYILPGIPYASTSNVWSGPLGTFVATASSTINSSWLVQEAFDGIVTSSSAWISGAFYNNSTGVYTGSTQTYSYFGEWIQLQMPSPQYVTAINIVNRDGAADTGYPKSFRVFGSDNSSIWTNILDMSNVVSPGIAGQSTYAITSPGFYTYYRLVVNSITVTGVATWVSIAELNFTANEFYQTINPEITFTNGMIGIGTTIPKANIHIFNTDSNVELFRIENSNTSDPFIITHTQDGNIGIGNVLFTGTALFNGTVDINSNVNIAGSCIIDNATNENPPYVLPDTFAISPVWTGQMGTYVAIASSENSATYRVQNAFNGLTGTSSWLSLTSTYSSTGTYVQNVQTNGFLGEWIQLQMPSVQYVTSVTITNGGDATNRSGYPKNFKVFGSQDGSTWIEILHEPNAISPGIGGVKSFDIAQPGFYSYYRLAVNTITIVGSGVTWVSIAELAFTAQDPSMNTMTTFKNGRIGIGTTLPSAKVHVYSSNQNLDLFKIENSNSSYPFVVDKDGTTHIDNLVTDHTTFSSIYPKVYEEFFGDATGTYVPISNYIFNGSNLLETGPLSRLGSISLSSNSSNYFSFSSNELTGGFQWWTNGGSTIECWVNYDSFVNQGWLLGNMSASTATRYFTFGPMTDGTLGVYFSYGIYPPPTVKTTTILSTGTWNHIAFSCDGVKVYLFINGILSQTYTLDRTPVVSSSVPFVIGRHNNINVTAKIADLRIIKGRALYTSSFIIPSKYLDVVTEPSVTTLLLLNKYNYIIVDTNDDWLITQNRAIGIGTTTPLATLHVSQLDQPQTSNILRVDDSSLNSAFIISKDGNIGIGTDMPSTGVQIYNKSVSYLKTFPEKVYPPEPLVSNSQVVSGITYTVTVSGGSGGTGYLVFNKNLNATGNDWLTQAAYNSTTGMYTGTDSTTVLGSNIMGEWLQLATSSPLLINGMVHYSSGQPTSGPGRHPRKFTVAWSANGVDWGNMVSASNITWPGVVTPVSYSFNTVNASYIRFIIEESQGSNLYANYSELGELIFTFASYNEPVVIDGGNIGIGVTYPDFRLTLSEDSAAKPTSSTWTISSDARLKTNIISADLDRCVEVIQNLPLRRFEWDNNIIPNVQDHHMLGWIAQEVEPFIPNAVRRSYKYGMNDVRSLDSDQIIKFMYGAIQRSLHDVSVLTTSNQMLFEENRTLHSEIASIKSHINMQ